MTLKAMLTGHRRGQRRNAEGRAELLCFLDCNLGVYLRRAPETSVMFPHLDFSAEILLYKHRPADRQGGAEQRIQKRNDSTYTKTYDPHLVPITI